MFIFRYRNEDQYLNICVIKFKIQQAHLPQRYFKLSPSTQ